jgi:hypothetical protein
MYDYLMLCCCKAAKEQAVQHARAHETYKFYPFSIQVKRLASKNKQA